MRRHTSVWAGSPLIGRVVMGLAVAPIALALVLTLMSLLVTGVARTWPWGPVLVTVGGIALASSRWGRRCFATIRQHRRRRRVERMWPSAAAAAGIVRVGVIPSIRVDDIAADGSRWTATLGLPAGMVAEDIGSQTPRLTSALGAHDVRITESGPTWVRLVVTSSAPFLAPVSPSRQIHTGVDLTSVPVGRTADGLPWTIPLAGAQVLVAGASGSGKGSILWSLIWNLSGAVSSGRVLFWAIDGKGGVELSLGRPLFDRFATNADEGLSLLVAAVEALHARAAAMAGTARIHHASASSPHVVVIIDELAMLTRYVEPKRRREVEALLGELLTQGRALGITVIGCLQEPSKETLALRDLFTLRIALRVTEPTHGPMVLGSHAITQGAHPDLLPASCPGMAWSCPVDAAPLLSRACWISDRHINWLTSHVTRPAGLHTDLTTLTKETES